MAKIPEGEIPPLDGLLPDSSLQELNKPFSLYVHVPYCAKRCGYCDFNTYTPSELDLADQINSWLVSAKKEVQLAKKILKKDLKIDTIFFGGGTPSLLDPSDLINFMNYVKDNFELKKDIEITLEANPDTINEINAAGWVDAGVNRISMGMQSSVKNVLKTLDRTHNPENVVNAFETLNKSGISNVSLDLIYGTPGESFSDWEETLNAALEIKPNHISAYALVIEPGTKMGSQLNRGEISPVDEDQSADKYNLIDKKLTSTGYQWYEISNWAKDGFECKHNLNYWYGNNWWGIGPGAHSHVGGTRWWNHKLPKKWRENLELDTSPALGREVLTSSQIEDEKLMLNIRLKSGVSKANISSENISMLISQGLIQQDHSNIYLTTQGRLLADLVYRKISS